MNIKIITIPFDEKTEGFNDEIIKKFVIDKKVKSIKAEFFITDKPYWSFVIC